MEEDLFRTHQDRSALGRGESLIEAAAKRGRGFPKPPPHSYAEARHRLISGLSGLRETLRAIPPLEAPPGRLVLALRLHPDFLSAAFEPDPLLRLLPAAAKVGARAWRAPLAAVIPSAEVRRELEQGRTEAPARLVFLAVAPDPFVEELLAVLDRAESALSQAVRHDLQRIERIDLLSPQERVEPAALAAEEEEGRPPRIELVLHPSPLPLEAQREHLFARLADAGLFPDPGRARFRPYPGGPTFVSLPQGRAALATLGGYNPLRTARPMTLGLPFPMLRGAPMLAAPQPPPARTPRAAVTVAVFDGGFDPELPLLAGHARMEEEGTPVPPHPDCVAHGTAVAGALLHGPLNPHAAEAALPPPPVSLLGFRVFPLSNPTDFDLYEAIDTLERVVPKLERVKLLNLSFGPRGPISDDNLSRFTTVLDRLAYEHDVLPIVAVGNDGALSESGRIQAPADSVNSLSVGAFSHYGGERYAVSYSCRGPGREGAKEKPDLAAFGGCERTPFHLVSARSGHRVLDHGTSYAAPLVARRCGELLARSPGLSPLLVRALMIHHSHPPHGQRGAFDYALGHGYCPEDADAMLGCPPKTVSILLDHAVPPKSVARFPLPLPAAVASGPAEISWTLAVLAPVDPLSSLEYTRAAVAATFYPDSRVFTFTPPAGLKPRPAPRRLNIVLEASAAAQLEQEGWTRSELPVSRAANLHRPPEGLRAGDLKWDTVLRAGVSMQAAGLHEPFLLLQATARNGEKRPVRFAGVVTLRLPKAKDDIYDQVVRSYPSLRKIAQEGDDALPLAV
ncbi:MAG: S8 family serine peptidase [Verrucomicrobium sp.]|nr:S8 family serine peptidase [Verrucomicrobium sp.]